MRYTVDTSGIDEVGEMLQRMADDAPAAASRALYKGAGTMAAQFAKAAETIKPEPFHYVTNGTRLPSPEEKAVVLRARVGVAKFDKNGSEVNTSVGYANAGYTRMAGKDSVPIPKIINAINSGTSFMGKQPFVRKAVYTAKGPAQREMEESIREDYDKLAKGGT